MQWMLHYIRIGIAMMAGATAFSEKGILAAWYVFAIAITAVAITTYHSNEKHIKALENALPTQTWSSDAWECSRPVDGNNIQTLFKGSVIQQTPEARDRAAFSPQLRTACHTCRGNDGKYVDGHELVVPASANATAGLNAATLASRSGIVTLGGFYNNAAPADAQAARCASTTRGAFYLVWNDASSELFMCYCMSGTEFCGDAMLTDGDPKLNCVGGSNTGLPTDCSGCVAGDMLC